jgi:2-succinyl-6-hydroxy-2,4-cyclohexadiene-1-carboxylate synthase
VSRQIRWVEVAPERRLFAEARGTGPGVLLLHGFTGTGRNLATSLHTLETDYSLLAFDCLGHGRSSAPGDPAAYAFERCAVDPVSVLDAYEQETVHVLGYGMGARLALGFAVRAPERVAGLVLVAPELAPEDPAERKVRRERDHAMAQAIESQGLSSFVDAWLAQPELATQKQVGAGHWKEARRERLEHTPLGLAHALRALGPTCELFPREELAGIRAPSLLIAGEFDQQSLDSARWLSRVLPRCEVYEIAAAGRAVHLEQSEVFFHVCRDFLRRAPQARPKEDPRAKVDVPPASPV